MLLIPENRSTSTSYLSSLAQLRRIFYMAGLNVRMGSIDPAIKTTTAFTLDNDETVTLEPVIRGKRRLGVKDFDPCTILLNNDLAAGVPGILEEIHEQYLLPPLHAGWTTRRKSKHFKCYEEVAKRMGKLLGVDPWLINPMFDKCVGVDLLQDPGLESLASQTDALLTRIRRKYKEYGIKEKPFIVVKTDDAAPGMGVVIVRDAKELPELSLTVQVRLRAGKTDVRSRDILLQEGVLTRERIDDAVAEPVVFMMDRYVVGGFYRIHPDTGVDENLNLRGSSYVPLAFEHSTHLPQPGSKPGASAPNRFYMYGVVARLAMLAASYELEATDPDAEVYS